MQHVQVSTSWVIISTSTKQCWQVFGGVSCTGAVKTGLAGEREREAEYQAPHQTMWAGSPCQDNLEETPGAQLLPQPQEGSECPGLSLHPASVKALGVTASSGLRGRKWSRLFVWDYWGISEVSSEPGAELITLAFTSMSWFRLADLWSDDLRAEPSLESYGKTHSNCILMPRARPKWMACYNTIVYDSPLLMETLWGIAPWDQATGIVCWDNDLKEVVIYLHSCDTDLHAYRGRNYPPLCAVGVGGGTYAQRGRGIKEHEILDCSVMSGLRRIKQKLHSLNSN